MLRTERGIATIVPLGACLVGGLLWGACALDDPAPEVSQGAQASLVLPAPNPHGIADTISTLSPTGEIDFSNPFFDPAISGNGRSCLSCHDPAAGLTITPPLVKELFQSSGGDDPLFSLHDAGNRPDADTSTFGKKKQAFSTLIDLGLTRFPTAVSPDAEFEVIAVDDPYGYGTPALFTRFRRPLATGSEGQQASLTWTAGPHDVPFFLEILMNGANMFHGQATEPLSDEDRIAGMEMMLSLFNAQAVDAKAGALDADGARGGPVHLSQEPFELGMNSGDDFDPKVFDIYDAWLGMSGPPGSINNARASIAAGQEIFNFKQFGNGATCGSCHNTPNVGGSSTARWLNIGSAVPGPSTSALPVVTVRNKATGEVIEVTDLGRALVTGAWNDIGRFKVGHLRGLAARAPYFHNGRAATLEAVVEHYDARFGIGYTNQEKKDLVAFLAAL